MVSQSPRIGAVIRIAVLDGAETDQDSLSQSPRIGAVIRIDTRLVAGAGGLVCLNPLESGQSFECKLSISVEAILEKSQSPRIGAVIRIYGVRWNAATDTMSQSPRIGAVIRIANNLGSLMPEYRSQSPRIGAVIRMVPG